MSLPVAFAPDEKRRNSSYAGLHGILKGDFPNNATSAAFAVALAILEATREKGVPVNPKPATTSGPTSKFYWITTNSPTLPDSLWYSINHLLEDPPEDDDELRELVRDTLLPRGLELIAEGDFNTLCKGFIEILGD